MKKCFLLAAMAAMTLSAAASAGTDTFTGKAAWDLKGHVNDYNVPQTVNACDFSMTGSGSGLGYNFRKTGITVYSDGADGYEYDFNLTASQGGTKGWICNNVQPKDGSVLRTITVNFAEHSKYPSGALVVYGFQADPNNPNWTPSSYTENGIGDSFVKIGTINRDNPTLLVYDNVVAFSVQADPANSNNALFNSISFEWGESRGENPGPQPQFHTWEVSDMTILGGPYNSDNKDAYLRLKFNLTNNGDEAASVQLTPRVQQGVNYLDFISITTEVVQPGQTIEINYKDIQTTHIPGELGKDATLRIDGDGSPIWTGPITVCNYSPKFTMTSEYDGKTGVNPDAINVPIDLTCTAGPYRGTLRINIYPTADCTSGSSIATVDLLYEIADGATANLTYDFANCGVTFDEDHTYGFSMWRTKANADWVKIGSNMSFETGKRQSEPEKTLAAPVINPDIAVAENYFIPAWAPVEGATNYQLTVYVGDKEGTVLTPYNNMMTGGETSMTIAINQTDRTFCFKVRATDGEIFSPYSELKTVTLPLPGSSVEGIDMDADAPAAYYDLQGRQVQNPQQGLYIVVRNGKAMKTVVR